MTIGTMPDCYKCIYFNNEYKGILFKGGGYICKAFPDGIPKEIFYGGVSHKKPYKGDHGIQFEEK